MKRGGSFEDDGDDEDEDSDEDRGKRVKDEEKVVRGKRKDGDEDDEVEGLRKRLARPDWLHIRSENFEDQEEEDQEEDKVDEKMPSRLRLAGERFANAFFERARDRSQRIKGLAGISQARDLLDRPSLQPFVRRYQGCPGVDVLGEFLRNGAAGIRDEFASGMNTVAFGQQRIVDRYETYEDDVATDPEPESGDRARHALQRLLYVR